MKEKLDDDGICKAKNYLFRFVRKYAWVVNERQKLRGKRQSNVRMPFHSPQFLSRRQFIFSTSVFYMLKVMKSFFSTSLFPLFSTFGLTS